MANNNKHTGPNVPALRFPEFSGEWIESKLGDIADFSKGAGISKDQRSEEGNPCILYGELYTRYKSEVITNVFSKTALPDSELVKSKSNDIIIPASGETAEDIATARCVPFDNILLGGDLNIIRLHDQDGKFFSYQLNGVRKYDIATVAQGVSVVHLHAGDLKGITVKYPSHIAEQEKISQILGLIDDRIATQSKIIEELKTLRSALRYKLLDEMMVERTAKLGELCRITTGKLDANAMVEGGGYPFFTCAEQVYEIDRYAFDTEALLVSGNGANLGHIHYYCGKFNVYQRTYVLSDFSEDIQYLRQYLEAYLSKRIESEKNTGNTPYIVLDTLADMEIKLPKVPEQQRIAHDLSVLSQKIENETHMFELFIQEKKTLLGKMFI